MAIDLETKDDGLTNDVGPGWATGGGHVLGVSASDGQQSGYFSVDRFGKDRLAAWLTELFQSGTPIVFHNAPYDLGWLTTWGVPMPRVIHDTMGMAAMLDENRLEYGLDACCKWKGIPGKDERLLKEAAAAFGITDIKKQMWMLPEKFYAPYATQDASATLMLHRAMSKDIEDEEITRAYELEMDLIPLVIESRKRGVPVDVIKAEQSASEIQQVVKKELALLSREAGFGRQLDISDLLSPESLERLFDNHQVPYNRTPKTNKGQFQSEWLRGHTHWLPKKVADIRFRHMVSEKFLRNYIISFAHNGRIHPEVRLLRDDDGGTRSYRLSYANPPLQQMSAGRVPGTEWVTSVVRGVFLPEDGERWFSPDYSQQEPRLTVHYAAETKVHGWEEAVEYYNDPNADYHQMVAEMANIPRKQAKIVNLGIAYGQGKDALAEDLGLPVVEAVKLLNDYHERVPFIKRLTEKCSTRAQTHGFIKLLDGARCRFDMWQPAWRDDNEKYGALPWDRAIVEWKGKRIKRAFTHKAFNRLIQGGASRQTKMAMRDCWRAGYVFSIQMHDELNHSVSSEKQGKQIADIMRGAVKLRVPVKVDEEYGHNWGDAKHKWSEL